MIYANQNTLAKHVFHQSNHQNDAGKKCLWWIDTKTKIPYCARKRVQPFKL